MPTAGTDSNFAFEPHPPAIPAGGQYPDGPPAPPNPPEPPASPPSPNPLDALVGTWVGRGFNTIWRPHSPAQPQDRFLELNITDETLAFSAISGAIPNRGLLQGDINMFGITYMQQISDASDGNGLHIEPGIWVIVPATTNPQESPTVVRMASIPHGTVVLAQGTATVTAGPPTIPDNNVIPFPISGTPPSNADFPTAEQTFTELNLATPSQFRQTAPQISQPMVQNPNSVLQAANAGLMVKSTTTLDVSTTETPVPGGGTANTAFLAAGNANPTVVRATFWIETVADPHGAPDFMQLQYSQTVMLDFNGLHWPHVTVATLQKGA